ncbi:MAG: metallophosphoesterase [Anaerolineales bacterium]|jgi:tartrate-resistant acid phosphatase type 5
MAYFRLHKSMAWAIVLGLLATLLSACTPALNTPSADTTLASTQPGPAVSMVTKQNMASTMKPPAVPTSTSTPTPTATRTPTATPTPQPVRFAVIGDYGSSNQDEADVAALVHSWNPDIIITTGDNNYPDGEAGTIDEHIGQYYHDYIYPYAGSYGPGAETNRFFPSLGNHDWHAPDAQPYLDYFELPGNERYYDFVWGSVHFFALDGDSKEPDGVKKSSLQAAWLKERLAQSTSPWNIVYNHFPPYSSALHGNSDRMQWPFQEWGASAVLAGHDHTYERIIRNGFPYFVNGLGGQSRYDFNKPVKGSKVRYNADFGAMLVEADWHSITFRFINRQGDVIDTYSMDKMVSNISIPVVQTPATTPASPLLIWSSDWVKYCPDKLRNPQVAGVAADFGFPIPEISIPNKIVSQN